MMAARPNGGTVGANRALLNGLVLVALLMPGSSLLAEGGNPALTDTHMLILGGYYQSSDIEVGAHRPDRPRRKVSLDDLGVDDQYLSWLVGYRWRMAPRWSLIANAYITRISGDIRNRREFEYNGEVYEVGAALRSQFSSNTYMLDLMYSAFESERFELLLGGGIHAFDLDVDFDARVTSDGEASRLKSSSSELLAPLPNLRLQMMYAMSDRWTARLNTGWLSVDYDAWSGRYLFANLLVDYRISARVGLGIGYQFTDMDVDHDGTRTEESFDIGFRGPPFFRLGVF